eukprot:TRINITY_DN30756_c0_g1_i1.p1 TRINITY_DN30756_c0_g1~~TRINITY_DN30756_c0_g1_i1.p1  ORF type:complete len:180 (+),score=62.80 TRINITY_DN30756_c0_g1_i1:93-632(+)
MGLFCKLFITLLNVCIFLGGAFVAVWCLQVYSENHDKTPGGTTCDRDYLDEWFAVYGVCSLIVFAVTVVTTLMCCVCDKICPCVKEIGKCVFFPLVCCFGLLGIFVFVWWIIGNILIWDSDESKCGELTTEGEKIMICTYVFYGVSLCLVPVLKCCFADDDEAKEEDKDAGNEPYDEKA